MTITKKDVEECIEYMHKKGLLAMEKRAFDHPKNDKFYEGRAGAYLEAEEWLKSRLLSKAKEKPSREPKKVFTQIYNPKTRTFHVGKINNPVYKDKV